MHRAVSLVCSAHDSVRGWDGWQDNKVKIALGTFALYGCHAAINKALQCHRTSKIKASVRERKQKADANIERFSALYPSPTPRQMDLASMDLPELRAKLLQGEIKAEAVVEAFIAMAVQANRRTNAVTEFLEDAISRAQGLDAIPAESRGPLHGVPISLKEHIHVQGHDATVGLACNVGRLCDGDAQLVVMLKRLGAVPFCRTNLPQTCASFACSNPIFGETTNPRDPSRGPGGSSGGESALIAAGGSFLGFGSDLGGSVRIPAAHTGITSLKPTCGRLPLSGQGSDGGLVGVVGLYNTLGFMARSAAGIEDLARELLSPQSVAAVTKDARFVPLPWREAAALPDKKALKIGWYVDDGNFEATPGMKRAVREAAELLRGRGHQVIEFDPGRLLVDVDVLYGQFLMADEGRSTLQLLRDGPVDARAIGTFHRSIAAPVWLREAVAPLLARLYSPILAGLLTAHRDGNDARLSLIEDLLRRWETAGLDVLLAPGYVCPAQPLDYPQAQLGTINYTCVYNLLDFPAGSLTVTAESAEDQAALEADYPGAERDPVYGWVKEGTRGAEGMPLNVQVVGRPWTEELVLRVMTELQQDPSLPWKESFVQKIQ